MSAESPRATATDHGVRYGSHVGFAREIEGLPLVIGQAHAHITLLGVDAALLDDIERVNGRGYTVMLAMIDGYEYTFQDCEAVAISPQRSSVVLSVGEVIHARATAG